MLRMTCHSDNLHPIFSLWTGSHSSYIHCSHPLFEPFFSILPHNHHHHDFPCILPFFHLVLSCILSRSFWWGSFWWATLILVQFCYVSLSSSMLMRRCKTSQLIYRNSPGTNTNLCPSVFCECASLSTVTVYPLLPPQVTDPPFIAVLGTVTSTLTVSGSYAAAAGACTFAASQASSITPSTCIATSTPTPPPSPTSVQQMTCSVAYGNLVVAQDKLVYSLT